MSSEAVSGVNIDSVSRFFTYDAHGRLTTSELHLDGEILTERYTYDQYGQAFQHFDASGDDFGQQFEYQSGYVRAVWEARYGEQGPHSVRYQLFEAMDAYGNVTQSRAGNGLTYWREHDSKTGLLTGITTSGMLQQWYYEFDGLGNLRRREDRLHRLPGLNGHGTQALDEHFAYDSLNRLTEVRNGSSTSMALDYANNGNIRTKSDVQGGATYQYGTRPNQCNRTAGPRAVSQIGTQSYCYDTMGNQTRQYSDGTLVRQIDYGAIGKASASCSRPLPTSM